MSVLLLQESTSAGSGIGGLFALIFLGAVYFLPAIIGRKKANATSITLLNLFLGWTLVGWVIALVWATSNDAPVQRVIVQQPQPTPAPTNTVSVADELEKLVRLRESGILSEAEFLAQKFRILGTVSISSPAALPTASTVPLFLQQARLRESHQRGEITSEELSIRLAQLQHSRPA